MHHRYALVVSVDLEIKARERELGVGLEIKQYELSGSQCIADQPEEERQEKRCERGAPEDAEKHADGKKIAEKTQDNRNPPE